MRLFVLLESFFIIISISLHLVFLSINMQIRLKLNALLRLPPSRWKIKRNSTWSRNAFACLLACSCSLARSFFHSMVEVEGFGGIFNKFFSNAEEKLMKFKMEFTFYSFSTSSFSCSSFHFARELVFFCAIFISMRWEIIVLINFHNTSLNGIIFLFGLN